MVEPQREDQKLDSKGMNTEEDSREETPRTEGAAQHSSGCSAVSC